MWKRVCYWVVDKAMPTKQVDNFVKALATKEVSETKAP